MLDLCNEKVTQKKINVLYDNVGIKSSGAPLSREKVYIEFLCVYRKRVKNKQKLFNFQVQFI